MSGHNPGEVERMALRLMSDRMEARPPNFTATETCKLACELALLNNILAPEHFPDRRPDNPRSQAHPGTYHPGWQSYYCEYPGLAKQRAGVIVDDASEAC